MFPFAYLKFNRAARDRYLHSGHPPSNLSAPCPQPQAGQQIISAPPAAISGVSSGAVIPMAVAAPSYDTNTLQEKLPWQQEHQRSY